ncbi:hypothetical protein HAX54_053285 [Datura stramonium]|uniref:Uncharacterized protein n=1 Tax=Datura stramonium TaxID=4076 RepID=A0ABS8T138_DATST|nr:hypothetical protein [Datura stramonium]
MTLLMDSMDETQFGLSQTALEMASMDRLLHPEDSVPCKEFVPSVVVLLILAALQKGEKNQNKWEAKEVTRSCSKHGQANELCRHAGSSSAAHSNPSRSGSESEYRT